MPSRRGPDNSVRVSISGTRDGLPWANVFYCQLTTSGTISQADLDAWLNSFQSAYKTNLQARLGTSVSFTLARAVLFSPGGGEVISQVTMTGAGTQAGTDIQDNAISKVISWVASVYWRGGKPRTYLPGAQTSDLSDKHQLTTAEASALSTAAGNFRTAINALTTGSITGTQLGFVSFRTGNAERTPPIFFAIAAATVHRRVGTQRRRLGKYIS